MCSEKAKEVIKDDLWNTRIGVTLRQRSTYQLARYEVDTVQLPHIATLPGRVKRKAALLVWEKKPADFLSKPIRRMRFVQVCWEHLRMK